MAVRALPSIPDVSEDEADDGPVAGALVLHRKSPLQRLVSEEIERRILNAAEVLLLVARLDRCVLKGKVFTSVAPDAKLTPEDVEAEVETLRGRCALGIRPMPFGDCGEAARGAARQQRETLLALGDVQQSSSSSSGSPVKSSDSQSQIDSQASDAPAEAPRAGHDGGSPLAGAGPGPGPGQGPRPRRAAAGPPMKENTKRTLMAGAASAPFAIATAKKDEVLGAVGCCDSESRGGAGDGMKTGGKGSENM